METTRQLPSNMLPVPRWTIFVHAAQMLLAIVILGFDAYGISFIGYYALIFSLIVCLLTLFICAYIIGTSLFAQKIYNRFIVLGAHILMSILWLVDLGVVANLAHVWASPDCEYSYLYNTYRCFYGKKRDLSSHAFSKRRDTVTINTYRGVLIAGAVFGAFQFLSWVASTIIVILNLNKHTANSAHNTPNNAHGAPVFAGDNNNQAIPMEHKMDQAAPMQPHAQPVYPPTQQYQGMSPQPQYSSPMAPPQGDYQHQQLQQPQQLSSYGQDPTNRSETVSPISQANTYASPPQHTAELHSPHHTGGYNPNVSELSVQK